MAHPEKDNGKGVAPQGTKDILSPDEFSAIYAAFIAVDRPGEIDAQTGEIKRNTDAIDVIEGLVSQIMTTDGKPVETTSRQPLPQPKLART